MFFPTKAGYFGPTSVPLVALDLQILNSSNNSILNLIDLAFWPTVVNATCDSLPNILLSEIAAYNSLRNILCRILTHYCIANIKQSTLQSWN